MRAVWARARAELRGRLWSWVAIAALVGLAGGVVIAAAAGARRTDTAYPRFLATHTPADVIVADNANWGEGTVANFGRVATYPRSPARPGCTTCFLPDALTRGEHSSPPPSGSSSPSPGRRA